MHKDPLFVGLFCCLGYLWFETDKGGTLLLVLFACWNASKDVFVDLDNDGFNVNIDCDDSDPEVYPGAIEGCDQKDNNCDGVVDEGYELLDLYLDDDGDGYGNEPLEPSCVSYFGTSTLNGDCNDDNSAVNPSANEMCDGMDNDCNGQVDDDALDATRYYFDADGDGFGLSTQSEWACEPSDGFVDNYQDCDDTSSLIYPNAIEECDGVDNDCDGLIDQLDDSLDTSNAPYFYLDTDEDGFGDPLESIQACEPPYGYVDNGDDCNDLNSEQRPSYTNDWCDGLDNDCDGSTDEDVKPNWPLVTTHEGYDGMVEIDPTSGQLGAIHPLTDSGVIISMDVSESGTAVAHANYGGSRLMLLDACNDQKTVLPQHNISGLGCGISFGPNGKLYAIRNTNDSLYEMDLTTGQGTLIGPIGVDIENCGLAYDCKNNALLGTTSSTDEIFHIDHTTGAAYNIIQTTVPLTISVGMEYDAATDSVFLATALDLYQVQLPTGASTYIGPIDGNGYNNVNDLAFHPACP